MIVYLQACWCIDATKPCLKLHLPSHFAVVAGAPNDGFGQVAIKWNQAQCLCVLHSKKVTINRQAFFWLYQKNFRQGGRIINLGKWVDSW